MKEVTLEGPNGEEIILDVPDDASNEDIMAFAQQNVGKFNQAQDGERELEWGEVGQQAWRNLPKSGLQLAKDLLQVVRHPIDTASSVLDLGMGIIELAVPGEQGHEKTARAVGQAILKRYHGGKNIKKTMANDPVGFASDLAAALTGGGTALSKIGQIGGKLAKTYGISNGKLAGAVKQGIKDTPIHDAGTMVKRGQMGNQLSRGGVASPDLPRKPNWLENSGDWLAKAGSNIDPMRQAGRGMAWTTKAGANLFGDVQGKLTGAGHDVMKQNFSAGLRNSEPWKTGMKYADDSDSLVNEALDNMAMLKYEAGERYTANLEKMVKASPKTSWRNIKIKLRKLQKSMYDPVTGKHSNVKNPAEMEKIYEIGDLIGEVMSDPKMHDAAGFDWLKQRVREININEDAMPTAYRMQNGTARAVHAEVSRAYPPYRHMQDDYHKFKKLEKELHSSFGKDKHTALDQVLRKLHQAMRNNANTGRKRGLLREIDPTQSLADQIAGQASRETMPRGMMGVGGPAAAGTMGALGSTGGALALVGLSSPRAMGKTNFGMGRLASPFAKAGEAIGPQGGRALSQGLIQAGRVKQINDKVDHEMTLKKKAPKKKKRK